MSVSARATRSESRAGPLVDVATGAATGLDCGEVVCAGVVCGGVDVVRGAATESGDDGADPSIAIVAKPNAPAIGPLGNGTCPKVDGEGEFDGLVFCSSMSFARKRRPAYVSATMRSATSPSAAGQPLNVGLCFGKIDREPRMMWLEPPV